MASSQAHGKRFEDMMKSSGNFPGSCDQARDPCSRFDIEARHDRGRGLPTSVKSTSSSTVCMGDARRVWEAVDSTSFRLLVGRYVQGFEYKTFFGIVEAFVSPAQREKILGDLGQDEVSALHEGISLSAFPAGCHNEARAFAKAELKRLKPRCGLVTLNPKIDSKAQRRLQCSLDILELRLFLLRAGGQVVDHEIFYGDLRLPISLRSSAREFA